MAKIGLLTTYNQDWAVTRYVDRFLRNFGSEQVVVLAESVSEQRRVRVDGPAVKRCWKRTSTNYAELQSTIEAAGIDILHVNCVFPFFDTPEFSNLIEVLRGKGIGIVAHVLDTNALGEMQSFLRNQSDAIFLDNHRAVHAAVAADIQRQKLFVVPSAITAKSSKTKEAERRSLGISSEAKVAVCFDFGLPESKIEDIIAAVYQLQAGFPNLHLYVLQVDAGTGFDGGYVEQLERKVASLHLDNYIHFVEDSAGDSALSRYTAAADVAILSTSRPQYEVREALGVILETSVPLVAVGQLPFSGVESLALQVDQRNSVEKAIGSILGSVELEATLREASELFVVAHAAEPIANLFAEVYEAISGKSFNVCASAEESSTEVMPPVEAETPQAPAIISSKLRVLMMNRSNALTHRGGDTVVMERVTEGLRAMGHHVDVDVEGKSNPSDYDIAHLYNFAIRESTEQMARRCVDAKTPYVVTTMYEDWPKFYNQMANHYFALKAYAELGQPQENWAELSQAAKNVEAAPAWDNSWTANHCAALIATGTYEAESLRRDYPKTPLVEVYRCGHEVAEWNGDGSLFEKETGLKDFVLCVGRLEWRKNQLMLLKALEHSDIPVVFATGGFTYQPEYEEVCRKFRRKGKTVYLGRMAPELLASAFCAARVHVLPSWFELPGLVSLEAAHYETNVVVTDYGTARDYLGEKAYYCSPDDDESILNAVTAAYYAPSKQGLRQQVAQFTWEEAARRNLEIYGLALGLEVRQVETTAPVEEAAPVETAAPVEEAAPVETAESVEEAAPEAPVTVSPTPTTSLPFNQTLQDASAQSANARLKVAKIPEVVGSESESEDAEVEAAMHCVAGDELLIAGEHEKALACYEDALRSDSTNARAFRSLAVVRLTRGEHDEAEPFFRSALRQDPRDVKSLVGLGAVQWAREEKEEAFDLYLRAAEIEPKNVSCVLYLVNAAYELDKLDDLEKALRRFLQLDKENVNIQYCLAGCYFRQEKYGRAEGIVERILQVNPSHEETVELREEIQKRRDGIIEEGEGVALEAPNNGRINQVPKLADSTDIQGPSLKARITQLEEMKRRKDYQGVITQAKSLLSDSRANESQVSLIRIISAECLASVGDYTQADSEFAIALSDSTYSYRAFSGRAALAASFEQWDEAEKLFNDSLERKADFDPAIAGLGIVAMSKKAEEEAWDLFLRALEINCENMQAIHGLLQIGYSLGRLAEVEKALRTYLDIHPVDLMMLYSLAGCMFAQGRKTEAEEQCRTILIFEQEHELALELLAKIETDDGRRASAGAS